MCLPPQEFASKHCSLVLYYLSVTFLQLPEIEAVMKKENQKILTPLVSLDTPGKATVEVVILADPVSLKGQAECPFLLSI